MCIYNRLNLKNDRILFYYTQCRITALMIPNNHNTQYLNALLNYHLYVTNNKDDIAIFFYFGKYLIALFNMERPKRLRKSSSYHKVIRPSLCYNLINTFNVFE